jgi:hypothetical protein
MTGRFKSTRDDVSFRGSVKLKGLNGFFDMARYVKRLDNDPQLYKTIIKWLNSDINIVKKLYSDWQDQAIRAIKVAFEELKDQEMASFKGYKSYF